MNKLIIFCLLINSLAQANNNESIWDATSKGLNSIWEKSKELGSESWEETKKYTNMGKNMLVEESLKTSMNLSLDTNTTEIKEFKINEDDSIKMVVKLLGEDKDLTLDIKNYDWGIVEDTIEKKKYIVFENIQFDADIPWIKYLLDFYIEKKYGYIILDHSTTKQSLLYSLKSSIDSTYDLDKVYGEKYFSKIKNQIHNRWESSDKKELNHAFSDIFDEEKIKIESFKINNEKVSINISLIDAPSLNLELENFGWATANKRKYIILKDIELNSNRPWINGILEKRNNKLHFDYSLPMQKILISIKPPIKGTK